MEREEQSDSSSGEAEGSDEMPHGHEGSDRSGGQVGVGTGGLGGHEPGGGGRREESSGQGNGAGRDSGD